MDDAKADAAARDHALGALTGLALGDALGMSTQSMSPQDIARAYGRDGVSGFVDACADQPVAPGMCAGSVTDDTEQAMLLARELVRGHGHVDVRRYARELTDWEARMKARGSLDLLGPSTRRALDALRRGVDPDLTGVTGTTNGGAMRATPLGVAFAPGPALVRAAHDSCVVTHNTPQGHESTLLMALAVSLGIERAAGAALAGKSAAPGVAGMHTVLRGALRRLEALRESDPAGFGHWSPRASVAVRVARALDRSFAWRDPLYGGDGGDEEAFAGWLRGEVGVSVEANESVAAACAVAVWFADRPFDGLLFAANLGGDTDTIAAMAGAMLGATWGMAAWPVDAVSTVGRVNGLDLAGVADRLLALRGDGDGGAAAPVARSGEAREARS